MLMKTNRQVFAKAPIAGRSITFHDGHPAPTVRYITYTPHSHTKAVAAKSAAQSLNRKWLSSRAANTHIPSNVAARYISVMIIKLH